MGGALILINGYPGVGKHAVARELTNILPNTRFFETRNLVAAASQLYDAEDTAHGQLRKNLKHAIFKSIAQHYAVPSPSDPPPPTYILTDFLSVSARAMDKSIMMEFIDFARDAGWAFIHIILSCDTETNVARFESPERLKLVPDQDLSSLLAKRMEEEVGTLGTLGVAGLSGEFEINTTHMDPKQAAGVLAEYCLDCLRQQGWWLQLKK